MYFLSKLCVMQCIFLVFSKKNDVEILTEIKRNARRTIYSSMNDTTYYLIPI